MHPPPPWRATSEEQHRAVRHGEPPWRHDTSVEPASRAPIWHDAKHDHDFRHRDSGDRPGHDRRWQEQGPGERYDAGRIRGTSSHSRSRSPSSRRRRSRSRSRSRKRCRERSSHSGGSSRRHHQLSDDDDRWAGQRIDSDEDYRGQTAHRRHDRSCSRSRTRRKSHSRDRLARGRSDDHDDRLVEQRHQATRRRGGSDEHEWQHDMYPAGPVGRPASMEPTSCVYFRGVPEACDEAALQAFFAKVSGVISTRLMHERGGAGSHKGFGFIDFATVADAEALLMAHARSPITLPGALRPLVLEYSLPPSSAAAAGAGAGHNSGAAVANPAAALDWICDMCSVVNFARRMECFQCSSARPANPKRVAAEPEAPSTVLKISGLEEGVNEEGLRYLFSSVVPLLDLRVVRDKFTGALRGFGFAEFNTIADAARALHTVQNAIPEGQATPIRLCFGRSDRAPTIVSAEGEESQAEPAAFDWAPKEFTEEGDDTDEKGASDPAAAGAAAAAGGGDMTGAAEQQEDAVPASSSAAQGEGSSEYVYDPATGYYHVPSLQAWWDANTSLFYFPASQQWCKYDESTGQYVPVSTGAEVGSSAVNTAGQGALAAAETALVSARQGSGGSAGALGVQAQRRKSATIGSAPQYNPQGLLEMAALLSEKEQQQKALAAQQSAQQKARAQAQASRRKPAQPRPAAPAPASTTPSAPPQQPPAVGTTVPAGMPVQGVIHRGRWSQGIKQ